MSDSPRPAAHSISRFPVVEPAALSPDLSDAIRATADRIGFTPNIFRAYAWRPEHLRAFVAYHDVLMKSESGLSRAERELIALAVSATNRCLY